MFPDGAGFYPDTKDGIRGYNTDAARGADTFCPFNQLAKGTCVLKESNTKIPLNFKASYINLIGKYKSYTWAMVYNKYYEITNYDCFTGSGSLAYFYNLDSNGDRGITNVDDTGFTAKFPSGSGFNNVTMSYLAWK